MSGLNTFVNYRTSHHTKATKLAVREQTAYVQQRDRDEWLESHPGRPFPESMLTPAERRYETRVRGLHAMPREQLMRNLKIGWIVFGLMALVAAVTVVGLPLTAIFIGGMAVYHIGTKSLWEELHHERPWLAQLDAPTVAIPAVGPHSA